MAIDCPRGMKLGNHVTVGTQESYCIYQIKSLPESTVSSITVAIVIDECLDTC